MCLGLGPWAWAQDSPSFTYKIKNQVCPKRAIGELTFHLLEVFKSSKSLRDLKIIMEKNQYKEKYFLDYYKISWNPAGQKLQFFYKCPTPIIRMEIENGPGKKVFKGTVVSNGLVYKEDFLNLIEEEKKEKMKIPYLSLPYKKIQEDLVKRISKLFLSFDKKDQEKISEIIVGKSQDMTIIINGPKRAASAFLGRGHWEEKFKKLQKIFRYFSKRPQMPVLLNLTNRKKVVVKF